MYVSVSATIASSSAMPVKKAIAPKVVVAPQDVSVLYEAKRNVVDNMQELVVKIPNVKGKVCANTTEKLLDALQKINCALKVNTKTPISEAKPTKQQNGENVYQCNQCEYWSHNKYYWKQHVDLVHNAERVYKCPFCDYAGKRSHSLKEHLVVHSNYRPYECGLCNASFRKKGHLTNHIKMHSQKKETEDSECSICHVNLASRASLFSHLRTLHNNATNVYLCEFCQYATTHKANMVMHMHAHGNPKTLCCNVCGYQTCHKNILHEHFVANHSQMPVTYTIIKSEQSQPVILMKCTECGFTAGSNDALRQHMYTHIDPQQQKADQSTAAAESVKQEEQKKPVVLLESKPKAKQDSASSFAYKCSQCAYTCKEAHTFINHMMKHKEEEKTASPPDPSAPPQPHIPGAKPVPPRDNEPGSRGWYQCTICGYLGQQRTIKAHIWKHSGHKDVSYPMFQNGPISMYDETPIGTKRLTNENGAIRETTSSDDNSDNQQQVTIKETTADKGVVKKESMQLVETAAQSSNTGEILYLEVAQPMGNEEFITLQESVSHDGKPGETKSSYSMKEMKVLMGPERISHQNKQTVEYVITSNQDEIKRAEDVRANELLPVSSECKKRKRSEEEDLPEARKIIKLSEDQEYDLTEISTFDAHGDGVGLEEVEIVCEDTVTESTSDEEQEEVLRALKSSSHRTHEEMLALVTLLQTHELSGNKETPENKPGICNSLLTVIEQLRERSKSVSGDDEVEADEAVEAAEMEEVVCEEEVETEEEELDIEVHGRLIQRLAHGRPRSEDEFVQKNMEKTEQGEYRCKLCHYSSKSALVVKSHLNQHRKSPSSSTGHECSLCEFTAKSSSELQTHMLSHCKMRTFQCKVCSLIFHYKSQLRAHLKLHSAETEAAATAANEVVDSAQTATRCSTCSELFQTPDQLRKHQASCKPSQICSLCNGRIAKKGPHKCKKMYQCEQCQLVCTNLTALRQHERQQHQTPDDLQCELCDFQATSVRSLKSHMKRHRNDQRFVEQPLEQYKCNLCGYVCHHLPSLKSHMWRHASDRNYSYQQTNHVINKALENCQVNKGTTSVITFRCCQCGFETLDKAELNEHMSSHEDIIQKTLEVNKSRILGKVVEKLQSTSTSTTTTMATQKHNTKDKENAARQPQKQQ